MIIKSHLIDKKDLEKYDFFLFYGKNEGYKKEKVSQLLVNVKIENIFKYEENEILNDENILFNHVLTNSLFNTNKAIIINRASEKIFKIFLELSEKQITDKIILLSSVLEKKSKIRNLFEKSKNFLCVAFYEDTNETLLRFVKNFFYKENISISQSDINLIVNNCNGDREILNNELNKIKLYSLNKKKITHEELLKLTNLIENHSIEELVDNCLTRNKKKISNILNENIFETNDCIIFVKTFLNKIKRNLKIHDDLKKINDLNHVINTFKPPIFWKNKEITKIQISKWEIFELKELIYQLNDIELQIKKNSEKSVNIISNFILDKCLSNN